MSDSSSALLPVTAVIITDEAHPSLVLTLKSLSDFSEILVYFNPGSNAKEDNQASVEALCAAFDGVRCVSGDFLGFGPTRNAAALHAENDWIFAIDSDETLNEPLLAELRHLSFTDRNRVYRFQRYNFFNGKHVKRGGWGNDWLVRLYHRGATRFADVEVHEKVLVSKDMRVQSLKGAILHQAVTDVSQFLTNIQEYSELRRQSGKRTYPVPIIALKAWWAFFRSYVLQLGFTAGWRGMVIAWSSANGVFYKYIKIYADQTLRKEKNNSPTRKY